MIVYKLDHSGNAVQEPSLVDWAKWYCENKDKLIVEETDIYDKRHKLMATVITRFRGQAGPLADPAHPLVWVTEATDGDCFGAVATRTEAIVNHWRMVRVLTACYKCKEGK